MTRYRKGVGMMMLNHEKKVFVGRRLKVKKWVWQMPQGGIDQGEEPYAAVLRELKEEIGTDAVMLLQQSSQWLCYEVPKENRPASWAGQCVGQEQLWFLLRFLGEDSDINIQTECPEFGEWRWTNAQDLVEGVISFKKSLYHSVLKEFQHFFDR